MAQESSRPRIGEGRIGSSLCAAIGLLSVAAVLCLRYPAFFTTPELRVHYDVELLRLTLAVDVDGNSKEASSVIHVTHRSPPRWLEHMFNLESRVDGDAVFLSAGRLRHELVLRAATTASCGTIPL